MTEREFLERRATAVKARLDRRSAAAGVELERAVGPIVRDHPRKSLAAGAAVGLVLGATLAPASKAAGRARSGLLGLARRAAGVLLRAKLFNAAVAGGRGEEPER